ncbi:MAG: flagellar biosynthesis protein FlgD [Pirellulales bacterium]|nr:flagellar biosynthesis protein FlgD [Pirellulales bacterium]
MYTNQTSGVSGQQGQQSATVDRLQEVDLDVFLKLMIAELQNQDPMNPMDNHELIQQVSQIREIESNSRLTETLEAVLLGQNMTTASGLIGRAVQGLTEDGTKVSGRVDRVTVADGKPVLHIGDQSLGLSNIGEILAEPAGGAGEESQE